MTGDSRRDLVALINHERASYAYKKWLKGDNIDLPPLKVDERLEVAAQLHAEYMAKHRELTHVEYNGGRKGIAERIQEQGYRCRPFKDVNESITSHWENAEAVVWGGFARQNMLNPHFRDIGVGMARASDKHRIRYWCANFGRLWTDRALYLRSMWPDEVQEFLGREKDYEAKVRKAQEEFDDIVHEVLKILPEPKKPIEVVITEKTQGKIKLKCLTAKPGRWSGLLSSVEMPSDKSNDSGPDDRLEPTTILDCVGSPEQFADREWVFGVAELTGGLPPVLVDEDAVDRPVHEVGLAVCDRKEDVLRALDE